MAVTGLHHIGIKVQDAARSEAFYTELLDFQKTGEFRKGESHLVFLRAGSCVLELIERSTIEKLPAGNVDHIALAVENIEEVAARAKNGGAEFSGAQISYVEWIMNGIKNVFFTGPDGERIELVEEMPKGEK